MFHFESRDRKMEKVKEIAECSICIELFTDPRVLPCIHTFCLKCLSEAKVKAGLKPGDSMPCPLCRIPFVIPMEGISGLKKNFFVGRLVDVVKISKPPHKKNLCDICIEDSEGRVTEIPAAIQFCIQCHKNICDRCCRDHKRYQALKDHQLIKIDSPLKHELLGKSILQYCDRHKKEQVKLFCSNCKQTICMICFAEEHNFHKCSDIEKAADQIRAEIKKELIQMRILSRESSQKCQQLVDEQNELRISVGNAEKAIIKRFNELKETIDRCINSLTDELSSIYHQEMGRLATEKEEIERHRATMESLVSYSDELISKGTTSEMCHCVGDLRMRNAHIQELVCRCNRKDMISTKVLFQSSELEDSLKTKNIVGALKVIKGDIRSISRLDLSPCLKYSDYPFIRGVTKLRKKIYVLVYNPNLLLEFEDQSPFRFRKEVSVKQIGYPENILSVEKLKSLFIFDSGSCCIWRMTIDDHKIIKWLSTVHNIFNVSSPTDHQLLICMKNASGIRFEIYESDGNLVRKLALPPTISNPSACVQKQNGQYIISHTHGYSKNETISQLSSDGRAIIRTITTRDETERLNPVCYSSIVLDSEKSRIFAADSGNHRIVLFDSNSLEFIQILLAYPDHEISQPYRLFYDSKKKELFVPSLDASKFVNVFYLPTT